MRITAQGASPMKTFAHFLFSLIDIHSDGDPAAVLLREH
jgi:hypothetical protein